MTIIKDHFGEAIQRAGESELLAISAQNTFTPTLEMRGYFNVSVWASTFDATVTLQRSFDSGTTWLDVSEFTANDEMVGHEPEKDVIYRIGVKTGDYGVNTVNVRIGQ